MVKKYNVSVNGKTYEVEVEEIQSGKAVPSNETQQKASEPQPSINKPVPEMERDFSKKTEKQELEVETTSGSSSSINAPMSGLVIDVKVKKGDRVQSGDKLLVLEAMKMENDIVSDISGIIKEVHCKKGDNVETGETLITIS